MAPIQMVILLKLIGIKKVDEEFDYNYSSIVLCVILPIARVWYIKYTLTLVTEKFHVLDKRNR